MPIGWLEIVIILLVVLLIFGPRKLPQLAHAIGKSIREYKKGLEEPVKAPRKRKLKG